MDDAQYIVAGAAPYLTYIGGPMLLFCSVAFADSMVGFVIDLMRQARIDGRKRRA
ncbi:hypothetical protein [Paenibacillus agricola]|uniref:Uncharacterized protein n=1 Tax=Paenibacillus agricola TaxID=2716264 RepID=A0ABX0JGF8_9BACL|nr:hypothetical protein [Paenibacillus agricola]NHN35564.1 hypothetical protein [Paenibacillus agricola]